MRIPTSTTLTNWIYELIRVDKLYKFYKTNEWLNLRDEVMRDHHYECVRCEQLGAWSKEGGRLHRSNHAYLARAATVHHEYEVRRYPSLALTRYIDTPEGRREVLHPLCNTCHNEIHGRLLLGQKQEPRLR